MDLAPSLWSVIERPGFAGKRRDQQDQERDLQHGPSNWLIAHQVDGKYYSWLESLEQFYEEAYYQHFLHHPEIVDWLAREASDVYDNARSNVASGLDYTKQEAKSNHMQDISIRRVMHRLGRQFQGNKLLQVRSHSSRGASLSPGVVPFHRPDWILQPELSGWWQSGSIESFWQSNKVLLVRKTT
jgi:hypothetical protein